MAGSLQKVTVYVLCGRNQVVVRVRDNGVGVAPENRRRIFQMFVRGNDELHRTKTGTGLGLYIVRTLVGLLKGRVVAWMWSPAADQSLR